MSENTPIPTILTQPSGILFAALEEAFAKLYQYAEHRQKLEAATLDFSEKLDEILKMTEEKEKKDGE